MKDLTAATNTLKYPNNDDNVMCSTFRLMGLGVTLTAADKCLLMEPQHLPAVEDQGKSRILRIGQVSKMVRIVRYLCPSIPMEEAIVNTNKLRLYFAQMAISGDIPATQPNADGETGGDGPSNKEDTTMQGVEV